MSQRAAGLPNPPPEAGEPVRCERSGRLGIITLDRPRRRNALDVEMAQTLRSVALSLSRDTGIGAVILRGAGGAFCSGVDLGYVRAGGAPRDLSYLRPHAEHAAPPADARAEHAAPPADARAEYAAVFKQTLEYLASTISEIRRAPKPVIAAVDGVAAAGGLGLALCCDLVVASERSSFEWAYQKTALSGAEGITFFLPRLIGLRRSLDLALLAPRLEARRALRMGLVSEVWPDDRFEQELLALGQRLAEGPTAAYARTKALLEASVGGDWLEQHLGDEIEKLVESAASEEFADGLASFFAPRPAGEGS
jgi:2-(1,2-epoxy-1,2-dihydrophenyl)acetyl-CoA isomerase